MKLKYLPIAALALLLPLSACSTPAEPNTGSNPSAAASASSGTESVEPTASDEAPEVDRDPQGNLPEISFDADSIPSMKAISDEAPSVITVKTLKEGDGDTVGEGAFVQVNYAGFLWSDGTEFDSSYTGGEPASFGLNQVVPGWKYGLAGTRVGDQVQVIVPPTYGYGDAEQGSIPANSTLVFVVEILGTTNVDNSALLEATPTEAELPAGVTVTGDLGSEPTIAFATDAEAPTEPVVVVLAEGKGPEVAETDNLMYHVAGAEWGGESSSTWAESFQQVGSGGGVETIGKKVGSRLLLVYPADEASETSAQVLVLDLMAAVPAA